MAAGGIDDDNKGQKRMFVVVGGVALALVAFIIYLMWPRTPEHVLIVGDSVTFMSWEALTDEFGSDTSLQPVARPGFRSNELLPLVEKAIDDRAGSGKKLDRAAFLVGYNDVWTETVGDDRLAEMVELSARYECAVWLTLPARPGGTEPAIGSFDAELAEDWNERMADLVAEHGNLHLVRDWAEAVDEASDPATYLEDDGIHPNGAGQNLLARTIHDAVINACRFP